MLKLLSAITIVFFMSTTAFAEHEGKYKIGKETYKYTAKTEGQQTAYIFKPDLPGNIQAVYDAVRFGISLTYGTDKLSSKDPEIVDLFGIKLLKFSARKGTYVIVTVVRNEKNQVAGFSMYESDK